MQHSGGDIIRTSAHTQAHRDRTEHHARGARARPPTHRTGATVKAPDPDAPDRRRGTCPYGVLVRPHGAALSTISAFPTCRVRLMQRQVVLITSARSAFGSAVP